MPVAIDSKELSAYAFDHGGAPSREARDAGYPSPNGAYAYGEQADLRHYWQTITKRLWLVISVPLAFAVVTALRDLMATRQYTAQATILIKDNAPEVYAYASMNSPGEADQASSQWKVDNKTEYTLLRSRSLAERVIEAEGLAANPTFVAGLSANGPGASSGVKDEILPDDFREPRIPPELISRYMRDLKVDPIEDTELVTVGLTTPNPQLSAAWPTPKYGSLSGKGST